MDDKSPGKIFCDLPVQKLLYMSPDSSMAKDQDIRIGTVWRQYNKLKVRGPRKNLFKLLHQYLAVMS